MSSAQDRHQFVLTRPKIFTRSRLASTLLGGLLMGWVSVATSAPCDLTWDGDRVSGFAKTRQLTDVISLKTQNNDVKAQVTAKQVLAFAEAKEVVTRQIGRNAKLLVCSDEAPNAFAYRGNDGADVMGVTVGMLKLLDGDRDAAAMVVGHEFAHHEKRHMDAAQNREVVIGMTGAIAGALLEAKIQSKTGVQGVGVQIADVGSNLVARKFDRDQEREADEIGFKHMVDAGFNPKGALRLADRMSRLGSSSGLFFDTHPGWSERTGLIQQYIASSETARANMARLSDYTPLASARVTSTVTASLLPLYESTDAEKSFADALSAFRRNELANGVVHLRASANAGYAKAEVALGHYMLFGRNGVEKNEIEAVRLFKLAAEQGQPEALNSLGVAYSKGLGGVQQSDADAYEYYRRALELGSGAAAKNLGDARLRGTLGLIKNPVQALEFYRKSAELGFPDGMAVVGLMYESGEGGAERDFTKALEQYRKAANLGSPIGKFKLGMLMMTGREDVPKDEVGGLALVRQAADQGNSGAQNELGVFYRSGSHGLVKNDIEAVRWYKLSAQSGYAVAQANLGFMTLMGAGGLYKDATEAGRLFRLAADQGNASGEYGIGVLIEYGEGGYSKDRDMAITMYRRAAGKGQKSAIERLSKLGAS